MKKTVYFLCLIFLSHLNLKAQTIDKSKKELNTISLPKTNNTNNTKQSSNSGSSIANSENAFVFFKILGYVTFGVIKYGIIGDYKNESHLKNNLNSFPFSINGRGNYSETDTLKTTNFRIDIGNQFLKSGNSVYGNHLDLKIRPSNYFYFETDYFELFEKNLFSNQSDRLTLFYFNFGYDRVRLPNFNLGWTLGASYVGSGVNSAGLSYGMNATYFLKQNISISLDSKWSSINQNPVNSFELKGNYFRKKYFGSLSYERLKIATPVYHFIGIGGGIHF